MQQRTATGAVPGPTPTDGGVRHWQWHSAGTRSASDDVATGNATRSWQLCAARAAPSHRALPPLGDKRACAPSLTRTPTLNVGRLLRVRKLVLLVHLSSTSTRGGRRFQPVRLQLCSAHTVSESAGLRTQPQDWRSQIVAQPVVRLRVLSSLTVAL